MHRDDQYLLCSAPLVKGFFYATINTEASHTTQLERKCHAFMCYTLVMSNTRRNRRPRMNYGDLDHKDKDGKVRDGTPQHASFSCNNHGGCPVCEGNRLHKNKKRMLHGVEDE